MEKQNKASLPSIVGDSEGSCTSGPCSNGPTPTVGDVSNGLRQQALILCQIGLSVFDPDYGGVAFEEFARLITAIYKVANDVDASL
jgi:hypothetical protein